MSFHVNLEHLENIVKTLVRLQSGNKSLKLCFLLYLDWIRMHSVVDWVCWPNRRIMLPVILRLIIKQPIDMHYLNQVVLWSVTQEFIMRQLSETYKIGASR